MTHHFLNSSNVNLHPTSWKLSRRNDPKTPKEKYLDLNP